MECDKELVKKLKNEYPEQFMSLVKMHLSFCLDQSTDEVDCLTPQAKSSKDKHLLTSHKKNRLPKQPCVDEGVKYASQIDELIKFLLQPSSLVQEGIFRRSGKVKQQQELMTLIKEKNQAEIATLLESNQYSVHEVATVLKNLLAEMAEPLLIESFYPLHCSLAKLNHPQRQLRGCQILVLLLPEENATILKRLLQMLNKVSANEEANKMNAMNLGIVLAPHILCPRKMSAEDLTTNASSLAHIVSFMIEHANTLFDYPAEFVSDVRLHFTKRDTEEDASSNASTPPVKTTITFVDREMTAKVVAEVGLDPTEAALAELYAYVQSQPESEIKKKWVHKFNKENGCGTPKVILNSSLSDACAKNCKNLSQSIRKHLFNGSGVTPKRRRSKSSSLTHALCYSGEASPPLPDTSVSMDNTRSPSLKADRRPSRRNLLESTPTTSDYIRHPAYAKHTSRMAAGGTPLASIPPEMAKDNGLNQVTQVISPLTQSAQRFPYYARDSIMTPRCRKPVFTFSPIDEPADDIVPNSDALQLANINLMQSQPTPVESKSTEDSSSYQGKDLSTVEEFSSDCILDPSPSNEDISSDCILDPSTEKDASIVEDLSCDDILNPTESDKDLSIAEDTSGDSILDSSRADDKDVVAVENLSSNCTLEAEESDHSFISGCALLSPSLFNQSSFKESAGPLTSPFKRYLTQRDMQVLDSPNSNQADDKESTSLVEASALPATVEDHLCKEVEEEGGIDDNDRDVPTEHPHADSLLDDAHPISQSLLEFLDGKARDADDSHPETHSSPTTRPSPPLTKSILFETSL